MTTVLLLTTTEKWMVAGAVALHIVLIGVFIYQLIPSWRSLEL